MPLFSKESSQKLFTCDKRLQDLMRAVVKEKDITIICGHRGEAEQEQACAEGKSRLHYPNSKHNSEPSHAVDFAPYHEEEPHIHWNDLDEFNKHIDFILSKAKEMGIKIKSGRDFSFRDYDHIQLEE